MNTSSYSSKILHLQLSCKVYKLFFSAIPNKSKWKPSKIQFHRLLFSVLTLYLWIRNLEVEIRVFFPFTRLCWGKKIPKMKSLFNPNTFRSIFLVCRVGLLQIGKFIFSRFAGIYFEWRIRDIQLLICVHCFYGWKMGNYKGKWLVRLLR